MKQTYRNREQGPMYSTRNYTQYLIIKPKWKRIWKRSCALYIYIYIYKIKSLCCSTEINRILSINYSLIDFKKKGGSRN